MNLKKIFDNLINYEFVEGDQVKVNNTNWFGRVEKGLFGNRYEVVLQTKVYESPTNYKIVDLPIIKTFGENELYKIGR